MTEQSQRTLWISKTGKPYLVFHSCVIPELGKEGKILNGLLDGKVIVLTNEKFTENFTKVESITYKDQKNDIHTLLSKLKK